MKRTTLFKILFPVLLSSSFLISCAQNVSDNSSTETSSTDTGPVISESRTESLDYLFNPDVLGETTVTVKRSEWNKMLSYYDLNEHNETNIHADYNFKKGSYEWTVKNSGLKLRGNTSRKRPQKTDGKYQQAHFKIGFEEWLGDDADVKISNCIKGIVLKRCKDDFMYVREIFSYNFFRSNGVWTAPRAAYTRLTFKILEDETDNSVTSVNYGVYEMIEPIDKQFLKERANAQAISGNDTSSKFKTNKGNLWKCTWKNAGPTLSTNFTDSSFGVEYIDLNKANSKEYDYDLKTNKENLSDAKTSFITWITSLSAVTTEDEIKTWADSHIDVQMFLKTYAINVILGMWDDYWINNNNYYFYFDKNDKAFFIPYDYDNSLGTNGCSTDAGIKNPLQWGSLTDGNHPLIQKLLSVPEYLELYKKYLDAYSNSESSFDYSKSSARIQNWQNLIASYINSSDLTYGDTSASFIDVPASWSSPKIDYTLLSDSGKNYFKIRQSTIKEYLNPVTHTVKFSVPTEAFGTSGIKINIINTSVDPFVTFDANEFAAMTYTTGQTFNDIFPSTTYCWSLSNGPSGYTMNGWQCDGETITSSTTLMSKDYVLTPIWKKYYTITFDLNGGTFNSDTTLGNWIINEGDDISNGCISWMRQATRNEGENITGWTETKDGTDYITTSSKDQTVYAHWEKIIPYNVVSTTDSETGTTTKNYVFNFVPSKYGMSGTTHNFYLMCNGNGWKTGNAAYILTKVSDALYSLTLSETTVKNWGWNGFKFYDTSALIWLGINEYSYGNYLSDDYGQHGGDKNFLVKEIN